MSAPQAGAVARVDSVYTTRLLSSLTNSSWQPPQAGCRHRPLPHIAWLPGGLGHRRGSEALELAACPAEHLTQVNSCFL